MNSYDSNSKKVDMVSHVRGTYLCRKNAMVAADLYLQKYPSKYCRLIFIYLNFLQNELALIVGTVGSE
jgi:hypothetical protein